MFENKLRIKKISLVYFYDFYLKASVLNIKFRIIIYKN